MTSDDLAEVLGPLGFGVGAGMAAAGLVQAAGGFDWIGYAVVAAVALLIGLVSWTWSAR